MRNRFVILIRRTAIFCGLAVGIANLFYLVANNLHPDEAYYWVWSRTLQPGYFDNAPGIAYLIRLFTSIGGNSEFWIRFPAWLGWVFIINFVFFFTKKIYQDRFPGYLAVLITVFTPLVATGSHMMTPDILMVFFASLTWYFLYLAIEEEKQIAWYGVGVLFGLALFTKFQAGLIAISVFAMLLFRPQKRKILLHKEPYLAFLIGIIIFSPVLYWNFQHQWAAFLFQGQHGVTHQLKFQSMLEFLSGQMLVFSLLFLSLIYYTLKHFTHLRDSSGKNSFLIGCFLPIFLFFSLTSLTYPAGPNWPAVAYLPAIIFISGQLYKSLCNFKTTGRWMTALYLSVTFLISTGLIIALRYPEFAVQKFHVQAKNIKTNESFGWAKLGRKIDTELVTNFPNTQQEIPIFGDESYQTASELQYYVKRPIAVFTTRQTRRSQFDYYTVERIKDFDQQPGLLVLKKELPANADLYFSGIQPLGIFQITQLHQEIRHYFLYRFQKLNAATLYEMALHKPLGYPGIYPD